MSQQQPAPARPSRYVIIGAGGLGVSIAAELQRIGRPVVLVGRGRQLELLRSAQVRYIRPDGERLLDLPGAAGPEQVHLERGDVIVLATKTQQADEVLAQWAWQPADDEGTPAAEVLPVVTLQNGLDSERSALRRFADVVGTVPLIPATYLTDGEIVSPAAPSPGALYVGSHPDGPASGATRAVAADLAAAGFEIQLVEDLSRWKAGKLVVSSSFVLDALYPAGPERDRAARLIQVETATILAAAGYSIAELETESTLDFSRFAIQSIDGYERQGSSTYQSLARTGDVETDFLNGEVVLLARQLGRRAPLNAALLARVHRAVRDGSTPGAVPLSDLAEVLAAATVRIDAATLLGELDGASAPAVLDVRWALGDPDGEKHYLDGHLPGAVYVDLDAELASTPSAAAGRHPLPEVDRLQVAARRWGLRAGAAVVVYDDNGGQSAARAWWLLRWAGVCDVRILDGGLRAWTEAGGEVVTGAFQAEPGDVVLTPGHLPVLDADAAAALPEEGTLVDARGAERYRGEVEPIDSRAGHIPGAISLPTAENLASNGRFRSVAELRDRFAAAGLRTAEPAGPVGVYCGSGVTAAHEIAALQIAGLDAALYPGSWSAWSGDPARPVATGAAPS